MQDGEQARTLKLSRLTNLSMPTSRMSSTFPSNMRTNVRPSGLFFVLWATTNMDASFLLAQNSSEDGSSNGRIVFFFENEIA